MRRRTVVGIAAVFGLLALVVVAGVGFLPGGDLTEQWVSDTPRDNRINHHAVGVGPVGEVVVAPVAEVPYADVEITNSSCELVRLHPGTGATMWQAGMPAEDCFTHALTEPAIEDIDGDSDLEVVISSTENALVVHSAADGSEEWRVPLSTYGYGRPTVADVTPAPGLEIVTSDIRGGVVVAHGNGTVVWRTALNATEANLNVWRAPEVGDFDADNDPEVLVGTSEGPVLLSADGRIEWQPSGSATYVAAAQTDADPETELFTADRSGIRAYTAGGDRLWERDLSNSRLRTATDGDGDGSVELYVGRIGGRLLALDAATGETEWSTRLSTGEDVIVQPPLVADVDGEGSPEVVSVLESGTVVVADAETGDERARYERDVPVWTIPTVADLDDDGADEILVRYGDGRVVMLTYS